PPAGDIPGEPAKVGVGTIDPLYGHPKRLFDFDFIDVHRFKVSKEGFPFVPRHRRTDLDDVIPLECRDRNARDVLGAEATRQLAVVLLDLLEYLLAVVDEIHLVDRQHEVPNSKERTDIGVSPCLAQNTVSRV